MPTKAPAATITANVAGHVKKPVRSQNQNMMGVRRKRTSEWSCKAVTAAS